MTPYYQDNCATIYCADSTQILDSIRCDAILSDPPYGIGYKHAGGGVNLINAPRHYAEIIGDDQPFDPTPIISKIKSHGGSGAKTPVMLWGANYYAQKLPPGQWVCWDKSCGQGPSVSFSDCEFAWSSKRIARNIYRQLWIGVCRSGSGDEVKRRIHPSQKPVGLMSWCLDQMRVGLGKIVCDPYMGSGSTALACIRSGRRFVGVEISETICATAVDRIKSFRNQMEFGLQEVLP